MSTDHLETDSAPILPENGLIHKQISKTSVSQPKISLVKECLVQEEILQRPDKDKITKALRRNFNAPPPDPEDALQSAIVKFIELPERDTIRNNVAFLYALARNVMIDELRKIRVRNAHRDFEIKSQPEDIHQQSSSPEDFVINRQRAKLLNEAIGTLPEMDQRIISLSRIEGKSYQEISKELGLSKAYISRSIQRSMGALLIQLKCSGIENE